jgi:hypothetical protein
LFEGYVIELRYIEHPTCECPPEDGMLFHIVRGKEWKPDAVFGPLTHPDGPDRPILANQCWNTLDDKNTACEKEPFEEN